MSTGKVEKRRIDQLLSQCGYCSRREADHWARAGRITVNGELVKDAAVKAAPGDIRVDGEPLDQPGGLFILMHKPAGYVCSHDVGEGPRVYDLLPERWMARNPEPTTIGRLDKDTTGVLLITDILPLVHRLTSPKRGVDKTYQVTVDAPLKDSLVDLFASGTLVLQGERGESAPCLPARLNILRDDFCELTIQEGKYHQVKRMFAAVGYKVIALHRSRFGPYLLDGLEPGQFRAITPPA